MLTGSVGGREELRHVQTLLTVRAPAELQQNLLTGTRSALRPLDADVKAEAGEVLPHRGGYAALMAKAAKATYRVTAGSTIRARVKVSAKGKAEERDVHRLNLGQLRHPVFGRFRMTSKGWQANPWRVNRITPGLVDRPVDRARDRLVDNAKEAAERFRQTILKD